MKRFVVNVCVDAPEGVDSGVGVVLSTQPLFIIVPSHLVVQLENDENARVRIDGVQCESCEVVPSSVLSAEHLTLLRARGMKLNHLRQVRLPKKAETLDSGFPIRILGCSANSSFEHFGQILESKTPSTNGSAITDVVIRQGDSGSALMAGQRLAGICQGMIPRNGNVAVALLLKQPVVEELSRIRNRYRRTRRALLGLAGAVLLTALAFTSFSLYERPRVRIIVPTSRTLWVAGKLERIWWETRNINIGPSEMLDMDFSSDGGKTWVSITPASNDWTEPWFIPDVSSTQCLLRMVLRRDRSVLDISPQFTIVRQ